MQNIPTKCAVCSESTNGLSKLAQHGALQQVVDEFALDVRDLTAEAPVTQVV